MSGLPPPPPSGSWGTRRALRHLRHAAVRRCARCAGLATALTVLFALIAIVEIAAAAALFTRAGSLDDAANGVFVGFDEASSADDRVTALVGLHLLGVAGHRGHLHHLAVPSRQERAGAGLATAGSGRAGPSVGGSSRSPTTCCPRVQLHQSSRSSDVAARQQGRRGHGSGLVILWAILWGLSSLTFVGGGGLAPTDSDGQLRDRDRGGPRAVGGQRSRRRRGHGALRAGRARRHRHGPQPHQAGRPIAFAASGDADRRGPPPAGTAPRDRRPPRRRPAYAASSPDWAAQTPQRDYAPPPPPGAPPTPSPPPPPAAPGAAAAASAARRHRAAASARAGVAPAQPQAMRPSSAGVTSAGWLGTMRTVMP